MGWRPLNEPGIVALRRNPVYDPHAQLDRAEPPRRWPQRGHRSFHPHWFRSRERAAVRGPSPLPAPLPVETWRAARHLHARPRPGHLASPYADAGDVLVPDRVGLPRALLPAAAAALAPTRLRVQREWRDGRPRRHHHGARPARREPGA